MFFNQRSCCSRCCRHCCGCGHDSNQITGTVTGYLPVTASYTMDLSGYVGNGFGFIPRSAFANDVDNGTGWDCGCGCSGQIY